ncbi:hypothetical protein FBY35_0703 [Streptomyces sp. SLBN-118]|nr:hypothetical protein FBY35_0703 [Streptomyces sp. SLBN-118]
MQLHIEADADTVYAAISTTEGITELVHHDRHRRPGRGRPARAGVPGRAGALAAARRRDGARQAARPGGGERTLDRHGADLRGPGPPERDVTLRFTHSGFPAVDDAYRDFTYGWATKFLQLKAYAETGKPAPFFTA